MPSKNNSGGVRSPIMPAAICLSGVIAIVRDWSPGTSAGVVRGSIGQDISYSNGRWEDLRTHTRNENLSIDVNLTERSLRTQAIGRNNHMFVGSDRGGRTEPSFYGLVSRCRRQQVDPFAYLKDILERLPTHPAERHTDLLPDN